MNTARGTVGGTEIWRSNPLDQFKIDDVTYTPGSLGENIYLPSRPPFSNFPKGEAERIFLKTHFGEGGVA